MTVNSKEIGEYLWVHTYKTVWTDSDNHVIIIGGIDDRGDVEAFGIIEVTTYKTGYNKGSALIWNLHVTEKYRRKGYGRQLLTEAISVARDAGCTSAHLEWQLKDSPRWVLDWYGREGFDDRAIGNGCASLKKKL